MWPAGIVKTHFYHIWVQLGILRPAKELQQVHDLLRYVSGHTRVSVNLADI